MRWSSTSLASVLFASVTLFSAAAHAACSLHHASDALPPAGSQPSPAQSLNENFPTTAQTPSGAWQQIEFANDPKGYAEAIRQAAKASIRIDGGKVKIDPNAWWTIPFMNYTNNGREHFNGLTRERTPNAKDLGPNSPGGTQVWAVGWYNAVGAYQFGKVWQDPCQPDEMSAKLLPEGTVSVKMLFTTASAPGVPTLAGSPEIQAAIDPTAAGGVPSARIAGKVRLLQVDFAVKDHRATETGWVFGTFAWIAPSTGDGVWDSLQLVGLHWGNDPGKTSDLKQGFINPAMQGKTFGWQQRPFMGFLGRVNGPADNKSSACLSCHARSQLPRASGGIAGAMPNLNDPDKVKAHLAKYFLNTQAGKLADPSQANAVPFDYSLQVMNAFERHCAACAVGDVSGSAPRVCKLVTATQNVQQCAGGVVEAFSNFSARPALRALLQGLPDRQ
jgi:hypothetical protein